MPHESKMTRERWLGLMDGWGFSENLATLDALKAAYSEKGRHYHSVEHIDACLQHLDSCMADIDYPNEVEMALWFHDAIYKPLASGNERKSADWAFAFLAENGAGGNRVARVAHLIVVTEHNAPTQTRDESILVDIDLAILGSDPETYDWFEKAVRREYKWVPSFIYRKKRIEILRGFLNRNPIYQNEPFFGEREMLARSNMARAVSVLEGDRKACAS